jgi:beta-N-acetylhexosaminidase
MVGFRGFAIEAGQSIVQDIQENHLGSVVLFDYDVPTQTAQRNIESPAQVKALTARLQSFSTIPLLIAIDQEGGRVCRLKEEFGFPPTVSAQHLGQVNDLAFTYEQAALIAKTLAQLGVNLNLAPDVDLSANPTNPIAGRERSFSADPKLVTAHARQFIKAHQAQGVLCTLKHFPGHGSSTADSHLDMVDVTHTWSKAELEPYKNIIKAGEAEVVMTAHVFNARLDPKYPATLSKAIITDLLRKTLNYEGVVISDDMQMKAISDHYGFETAVQAAIEAGVDIIALANNSIYEEGIATRTVALIKQLAQAGKISEARITESYERIQRLKRKLVTGM